ncbi:MAG: M23 family metallopeptidase [Gemmatimonadetes bacterium]|nr:M23 family metallopeptidase [Gemmatimonadota bacterium]
MNRLVLIGLVGLGMAAWLGLAPPRALGGGDLPAEAEIRPVIRMEPAVTWLPDAPGEGRLFRVRVTASEHTPLMGVHGSVGGEELHFERTSQRDFESLAAMPVGAEGGVTAQIRAVYRDAGEGRLEARIPVTPGSYSHEALRVAPRFGSPLSETDQARLDSDRVLARRASARAHRTPRLWGDFAVTPRESVVTSGFGDGRVFNGQVSSRHMGLDLRGDPGDTVVAAARGIVEVVAPFLLAGNVVYLNHGGGVVSGYFHLSRQLVAEGDTVAAGTPIGLVGATGRVTGPHLHWVVRYGNVSVDPRSLVELADSP